MSCRPSLLEPRPPAGFRPRFGSVDWLKPVLPAFEHILSRARWEHIGDCPVRAADAEGLILLKLIAFRPHNQEDIKGMLATNSEALDLAWIRSEWFELAGADEPKTEQFEQMVREFYDSGGG